MALTLQAGAHCLQTTHTKKQQPLLSSKGEVLQAGLS